MNVADAAARFIPGHPRRRRAGSGKAAPAVAAAVIALSAGACDGPQSALDPAGPAAQVVDQLGWVMWSGTAVVLVLVSVTMLIPFFRPDVRGKRRLFLWGGGVVLPAVSLTALLVWSSGIGEEMRRPDAELSITIVGRMFWWEIQYEQPGSGVVVSANELHLPVGKTVEIRLRSEDVIHSFWIPSLAGKTDMVPGRENRMTIEASRSGVYRGQCAEFCGAQHALMALPVIAVAPTEFETWLGRQAQPARPPVLPFHQRGREAFVSAGCGECHAVRGVIAGGRDPGPDLTHVGSRLALAAGTLDGGVGNLAAWIASAQHLKPGNAMPSFDRLDGPTLRAMADWLESLE